MSDTKDPRGRPLKSKEDKKIPKIAFRVTEGERHLIREAAKSLGIDQSRYIRTHLSAPNPDLVPMSKEDRVALEGVAARLGVSVETMLEMAQRERDNPDKKATSPRGGEPKKSKGTSADPDPGHPFLRHAASPFDRLLVHPPPRLPPPLPMGLKPEDLTLDRRTGVGCGGGGRPGTAVTLEPLESLASEPDPDSPDPQLLQVDRPPTVAQSARAGSPPGDPAAPDRSGADLPTGGVK